jgi:hypothetical protein
MATVLQQVLDRLDAVLKANVPAGTQVFRDRADAESRADAPSVNVLAQDAGVDAFSAEFDRHEVLVDVLFYVRVDPGTPAAETLHAAVHAAIVNDATLATLCESRRLVEYAFDRAEADQTATHKKTRYRFTYLIPSDSL